MVSLDRLQRGCARNRGRCQIRWPHPRRLPQRKIGARARGVGICTHRSPGVRGAALAGWRGSLAGKGYLRAAECSAFDRNCGRAGNHRLATDADTARSRTPAVPSAAASPGRGVGLGTRGRPSAGGARSPAQPGARAEEHNPLARCWVCRGRASGGWGLGPHQAEELAGPRGGSPVTATVLSSPSFSSSGGSGGGLGRAGRHLRREQPPPGGTSGAELWRRATERWRQDGRRLGTDAGAEFRA